MSCELLGNVRFINKFTNIAKKLNNLEQIKDLNKHYCISPAYKHENQVPIKYLLTEFSTLQISWKMASYPTGRVGKISENQELRGMVKSFLFTFLPDLSFVLLFFSRLNTWISTDPYETSVLFMPQNWWKTHEKNFLNFTWMFFLCFHIRKVYKLFNESKASSVSDIHLLKSMWRRISYYIFKALLFSVKLKCLVAPCFDCMADAFQFHEWLI